MKNVVSDDILLCLYDRGNTSSSTLLIFLHGGPGSGAQPLMSISAFQRLEEYYHCIYFDQRGCEHSHYDVKQGLTQEQLCRDVKHIIEDCKTMYPDKNMKDLSTS